MQNHSDNREAAGIDPTTIMQLATGYWSSATLLAANELEIFATLADAPLTATEIASRLKLPLRPLTLLLDACVGLQLLHKIVETDQSSRYANSPASANFLVPGQPGYLGTAIRWANDQYRTWGELARSVREDRPAVAPSLHLGEDLEQTRRFVLGMHGRALGMARAVVNFLPFEFPVPPVHSVPQTDLVPPIERGGASPRLLDVGGGPGTYAMLLAQKHPDLMVTLLDLPGIVAVSSELIQEAGLSDRVTTLPEDATTADYGEEEWDGILFSGVLHQMEGATIRMMLAKAFRALRPGAKVVISDMMLDASKTAPVFSTLFSLQMLLVSERGAVFSTLEAEEWLQEAGFTDVTVRQLPPPLPYVVVAATR